MTTIKLSNLYVKHTEKIKEIEREILTDHKTEIWGGEGVLQMTVNELC